MASIILHGFDEKSMRRTVAGVRIAEVLSRDATSERPRFVPAIDGNAVIPAVVKEIVEEFAPNRWLYRVSYGGSVIWDAANRRWINQPGVPSFDPASGEFAVPPPPIGGGTELIGLALNSYEYTNTATAFGHGTPISQGSGSLIVGPIPVGEPIALRLNLPSINSQPAFEFYAVNPQTAGCNP